jgi:hypothetical protein
LGCAFPLLFLLFICVPRSARRLAGLIVVASLAWFSSGDSSGDANPYYMFHYFMGSKYFPETGYFDLIGAAR